VGALVLTRWCMIGPRVLRRLGSISELIAEVGGCGSLSLYSLVSILILDKSGNTSKNAAGMEGLWRYDGFETLLAYSDGMEWNGSQMR